MACHLKVMERYVERPHRLTHKVVLMQLFGFAFCGVVIVACHPIMLHHDSPGCIQLCRLTHPCARTHAFVPKLFSPLALLQPPWLFIWVGVKATIGF